MLSEVILHQGFGTFGIPEIVVRHVFPEPEKSAFFA
ncbi:hypothetical protein BH10CYA1_BH10CYA1_17090 [soil metagenome]